MKSHRYHLIEQVYLAGPSATPEQRAFNARILDLARAYNFPMFSPEEAARKLSGEDLRLKCLDAMDRSHLMLAVLYGNEFDPQTAFAVGYALGRRHQVLAIHNLAAHPEPPDPETASHALLNQVQRIITVTPEKELTTDRLIPVMNCMF